MTKRKGNDVTRNLPSLRSIVVDPTTIRGLSLDTIEALLSEADAESRVVSAAKKALTMHLEDIFGAHIAGSYAAAGKDFGTIRIAEAGFEVIVDTPKRVEWDQDELQAAGDRISAAGDNPREYIETKLSVDERKFTAWPEHIRKVFEAARLLKPGSRTIKLVRKEAA